MSNWIWAVLVFLFVAVIAFVIWRRFIHVSRLVHTFLPPYEIPDVILMSGVYIENRGWAAAPNVKLTISFPNESANKIHHMDVESEEPYILRGGGVDSYFATIRLRRIGSGKRVFVYWAAADRAKPQVSVTSYQPSLLNRFLPRRAESTNRFRNLFQRSGTR